jgi:hypothetical protein
MPWAAGIKESSWKFPLIESIHSLGISAMIWPAAILDLRLLGFVMKRRPVSQVAGQFLPWVWAGFSVMVLTGIVIFCSEAVKCYNSPFFRVKLILIAMAGMNALVFHKTIYSNVEAWDKAISTPFRARLAGAVSLLCWIGVIAMGRVVAYA